MRFEFCPSEFGPIAFLYVLGKSKQSSYAKNTDVLCVHTFKQTPRPTAVCCGLAPRRDALRRCTARRIQASEPTLSASGLAAKRRAESARVNLSWYFVL